MRERDVCIFCYIIYKYGKVDDELFHNVHFFIQESDIYLLMENLFHVCLQALVALKPLMLKLFCGYLYSCKCYIYICKIFSFTVQSAPRI